LWLPFSATYQLGYSRDVTQGTNAVLLQDVRDPADAALQIGTAAATALSKIGSKNAA